MGSDQSTTNGNQRDNNHSNHREKNRYERIRTPYSYSQTELPDEEVIRQFVNVASPSQPHPAPIKPTHPPPRPAPVNPTSPPNSAPTHPHPAPVNPTPSSYPAPIKHTTSQPYPATLNPSSSAPLNTNPPPSYPAPLYPNISHPHQALVNPNPSPNLAPLIQTPSHSYTATINPPPSAPSYTNTPPSHSVPTNHQAPVLRTVASAPDRRDVSPASTSRRSASRNGRNSNDKYKCPSCSNSYGSRIYMCPSGHSGCDECRNTATLCALCGLNFTDRRNYGMENFLDQMKFACPNASEGCRLYLRSSDMETHVSECPYGMMDCPVKNAYGNCRWRGKPNEMVAHFDRFHPVERSGNVNIEYTIPDITSDSHNLYLVELSPYCFILHEKVDGENVYITVQLLGTAMSASKWNYEVHVYKKSEPRRKYTYMGPCFGVKSPIDDIFSRFDCAVLPFKYGNTLANGDRLTYKIFIKKQENDNPKNNFSGRGRRPPHNKANYQ